MDRQQRRNAEEERKSGILEAELRSVKRKVRVCERDAEDQWRKDKRARMERERKERMEWSFLRDCKLKN